MSCWITYGIIAALLLVAELVYFKIADHFNIIDKPNERSSHSTVVLRGGGVIFTLSIIAWAAMMLVQGNMQVVIDYLPFLCGLIMVAGISFSLFIEIIQLTTSRGCFDLDDVLLNGLGTVIGFGLYSAAWKLFTKNDLNAIDN